MADTNMFDIHNSLINKKQYTDDEINRLFTPFISLEWLSIHPKLAWELNAINSAKGLKYIPKIAEYKAIKYTINLPKNTRFKIPKSDKNEKIIIKTLMKHFNINKTIAKDYINILGGKKILDILELYARRTENRIDAKSIKFTKDLRTAISAKKQELNKIKGTK